MILKRQGGAFWNAGQCLMYWSSDMIPWVCTHVNVHQTVHLIFVPFSACKQYLKRNYLREFSILRESFLPVSGKAQSKSLQQLRCLRARWWWWRKAEMTTWPVPGFCWDLLKGSYGSITQNLNQKRHSSVMSIRTNYSIRFIMLWFWPPRAISEHRDSLNSVAHKKSSASSGQMLIYLGPSGDQAWQLFFLWWDPKLNGDHCHNCLPWKWEFLSTLSLCRPAS